MAPQMHQHPGFQHVRHGTPSGSPPLHNGAMPQFQRGPSPLPPGGSRPSSRTSQHPSHRRTSSNLAPPTQQQQLPPGTAAPPSYAYQPNPPFYNAPPGAGPQMQQRPVQHAVPHQATYPPPFAQQAPQVQAAYLDEARRASMPPNFPQQQQPHPQALPTAHMHRNSQELLQPPPQQPQQQPMMQRHPSPQPQLHTRPTPSPQPPQQHQFTSPPIPQPRPLPAAKAAVIFTPIDDSRSMLAQHWGTTSEIPRSDTTIKTEDNAGSGRSQVNGSSPPRPQQRSPPRPNSTPIIKPPARSNTNTSTDAKRPRLTVQIPSEQSGDEASGTAASAPDDSSVPNQNPQASHPGHQQQQNQQPHGHGRVLLPPPSPSAGGALLSAGAQGPPNPFARPPPPMSTNPHAMNRESAVAPSTSSSSNTNSTSTANNSNNNIETPISALPSRFMSDTLLPSPSTFYPEWNFGRAPDSSGGLLPSPLNFQQTPIAPNGGGWRDDVPPPPPAAQMGGDKKRAADGEGGDGVQGEAKRVKA